eukprot:2938435-Ditylum_brightwellii.AAC.1
MSSIWIKYQGHHKDKASFTRELQGHLQKSSNLFLFNSLHVMGRIEGNGRQGCEICKFLWKTKKFNHQEPGKFQDNMKRATLGCIQYKMPLCKDHFHPFHHFTYSSV